MKRLSSILMLVVMLGGLLSACVQEVEPTATPAPTTAAPTTAAPTEAALGPVLKIGQISQLSGVMALYGQQQVRGFELGLEYASGGKQDAEGRWIIANRPVEVITRDDEGNPEKGVAAARELIEKDGVEILQGPVSSAVAVALTTVAQENKIVLMIDPAASSFPTGPNFNPYVFRTARTNYDDVLVIAKYLVENVGKKFAHIGVDNAFGQGSGIALAYAVEKYGGRVVDDIYAPFDTTDFTPYIQRAMDSGADCLFLTWSGTGYVTLFQQLADLGALEQMTVATGYGDNASFAAVYGSALGQIGLNVYHYTVPDNPINDWLVKRHLEEYNEPPDLFTAGGMASALALAAALEKTGGNANGDALIPALEGLKFEGPKGTYYIRPEDHVCEQPMNILKLVNLDPDLNDDGIPEYKFFETVYVSKYDELGVPCTLTGEYESRCAGVVQRQAEQAEEKPLGPVLKIGQISMLSGVMALYGQQQVRGFELGLEYASGGKQDAEGRWIIANRPVEVITRDDEGNPEKGVAAARELIEKDGVEILQGPVSSAVAVALTTVAQENKIILMIDPAASSFPTGPNFNPYVFRTARTNYDDVLVIAKYLVENVGRKFAHIGVDNAFGQGSGLALAYAVGQYGGEVVADIYAPFDTTDFTPYIQRAMDSGADCLFLTWSGTGYVTLFQQLADLGALEQMTVATGYGDNASFAAVYGSALGQIGLNVYHYTAPNNAINDWLVKRHLEEYNEPPDLFTAGGMASALALAAALEKTGGDANGDALIPALEGLKFQGPKGTYYIRPEDHVCEQPMNILKLVNLDPDLNDDGIPEYQFFETVYISEYNELGVPCTLTGEYASRCGDLPKP